jgi:iron complex outermembrane receptor protein
MIKYFKILFVTFISCNILYSDDLNIDTLLKDIELKTDLSSKTKLANSGVTIVYTRDEMNRMQVHNLKDILNVMYPIGYSENYYGTADPHSVGTAIPFMSSSIRVYIDNQEMMSGTFGSGFATYGNMDIDFIDHIEVYYGNPTYQFSTEPAFLIIKMYSKVAQKDAGSKVTFNTSTLNGRGVNFYNSQELDKWSYFVYGSTGVQKRKEYTSDTTKLSKDRTKNHLFASFYKDDNKILIDAITEKAKGFIGPSIDATPIKNDISYDSLHIGYDGVYKDFSFLFTYDYSILDFDFLDDPALISSNPLDIVTSMKKTTVSNIYTTSVKYKKDLDKHKIITGLNYRLKQYDYPTYIRNGVEVETSDNPYQTLSTVFIEDQYSLFDNSIFTGGFNYTKIRNDNSIQQDELHLYRLGYTHTTQTLTSKTIFSHIETSLEPYLINNEYYMVDPNKKYDKTKQDIYMENIIYEYNKKEIYELVASYMISRNQLMPDFTNGGRLDTYLDDIIIKNVIAKYKRHYNNYDSLELIFGATKMDNIPKIDSFEQYDIVVKSIISIDKYDIFNELASCQDTIDKKLFYNYNLGIKYHYNDDITISIKGENLFDKARESKFARYKQLSTQPYLEKEDPLEASSVDQQIILRVGYTF